MTFTAEPNIGSHLVEATPPNLLEHIDELGISIHPS